MAEPASRTEVLPSPPGRDWTPWLSLVLLLLACGLAFAKALGQGLSDLQAGHHMSTVYAAVLAYEYSALPITGLIFVAWVFLVARALRHLRQPAGRPASLIAASVTSVALVWAGASSVRQLFVGYEPLTSVTTSAEDYHLGIRTALDGDFFFVVTQCPHGRLRCAAFGVTAVGPDERHDVSHVRLTVGNTSQELVIHTATRTIPFRIPPRYGPLVRAGTSVTK